MYGHLYEDPFGHTTRGPLQSGWNGHVLVSRSETRLYPGTILYIQFSIRVFTNFVEHRKSIIKIVAIKREWRSIQAFIYLTELMVKNSSDNRNLVKVQNQILNNISFYCSGVYTYSRDIFANRKQRFMRRQKGEKKTKRKVKRLFTSYQS
ncbi:uncharacterized protein LOC143188908 isoform X1 [Calliopsis andreniformis]|uniref:uncharacterized protein LOC143188908 isoform X1 n=1 Tax=Calliopsis andreniformis TaxID=337506 RepID=UPI003FCED5E2